MLLILLTTEKIFAQGEIANNSLRENDFLYAQMNYDLNNDNDYKDIFSLKKKSGKYYLNGKPLKVIISPKKFRDLYIYSLLENNKLNINQVSKQGLPFIIYNIGSICTLNIDAKKIIVA